MSNEHKSIHDFDFNIICEYFTGLHRQGPGSPEVTVKALGFIDGLSDDSAIADVGCGTGGQTLTLAQSAPGRITGIDLFPEFIDIFNRNMTQTGLSDRIEGRVGNMENLPFEEESLDLIWAEGSIYNVGYGRGLREWRRLLRPGGYIAVTEVAWLTPERPAEIEEFWMDAYDQIDTIPAQVAVMQEAGYMPVAHFVLPEECWTEHFYAPMPPVREAFLTRHAGNPLAEELVENQLHEQRLYMKYKQFYGYVFHIGRKL